MKNVSIRPLAVAMLLGASFAVVPASFAGDMQQGVKNETLQPDPARTTAKSRKAAKEAKDAKDAKEAAARRTEASGNAAAQAPQPPLSASTETRSNGANASGSAALTPTPPGRGDPLPPGVTDPPAPGGGMAAPKSSSPNGGTTGGTGSR